MPMVVMKEGVNESSLNRSRQHDLPTPESPIRRSLIYMIGGAVSTRWASLQSFSGGRGIEEHGHDEVGETGYRIVNRSGEWRAFWGRYEMKMDLLGSRSFDCPTFWQNRSS